MNQFIERVEQRIYELRQIIKEKEAALSNVMEGVINIAKSENRIQFYYKKNSSDTVRKYLKNDERQVVEALCQKAYDQKVLSVAQKELFQLERLMKQYPKRTYEDVYEDLNMCRKEFVQPIVIPEGKFVKEWKEVKYLI